MQKLSLEKNLRIIIELIRARLKTSDFNSLLGIFWSLLGPFIMLVIMYAIFRGRFGSGVKNYPLYILTGIIFLNYFVTATTNLLKSLFYNREMVLNSSVPREYVFLSDLFVHTYKFIIELVICALLSYLYASFTFRSFLLLLPLFFSYLILVIGISFLLMLIYSFANDIEHVWGIFSRFVFFVTPVFFTLESISSWARQIVLFLNPLTPFLLSFRGILLEGGRVDPVVYLCSLSLGVIFFGIGYFAFIIFENAAIERV